MKKILALLLLVSFVSTPSLAYAQASRTQGTETDTDTVEVVATPALDLGAAAVEAARKVVTEDVRPLDARPAQQVPGRAGSGWRTAIGIAMLAGGAAIVWKGADIYQDEPDRFDRTKNSDAYLAWGVGAGIMGFGFLTLKGGLEGRGF